MFEILIATVWIVGFILAVLWLFLPWIIVSKLDQIIDELHKISSARGSK